MNYNATKKAILKIEAGAIQRKADLEAYLEDQSIAADADAESFTSEASLNGFRDLCVDVVSHMAKFQKDAASELTVPDQKWEHFASFFGPKASDKLRRPLKTWLVKLGENADTLSEVLDDDANDVSTPESIYKAVTAKLRVEDTEDEMLAKLANKFFKKAIDLGRDGVDIRLMLDAVAATHQSICTEYFQSMADAYEAGMKDAAGEKKITFKNVA
ncbi:MAG: hypothetical protein ACO3LE_11520 [Bdellovibrionota bacterium]